METESTVIEFSQKVVKLISGLQAVESKTGMSLYVISETMRLMDEVPEFIPEFIKARFNDKDFLDAWGEIMDKAGITEAWMREGRF